MKRSHATSGLNRRDLAGILGGAVLAVPGLSPERGHAKDKPTEKVTTSDWQGMGLYVRLSQHDPDYNNRRVSEVRLPLKPGRQDIEFAAGRWAIEVEITDTGAGGRDVRVSFRLLSGTGLNLCLAVDMDCAPWSAENYVLMPGAVYNGNRFDFRRLQYSPKLYEVQDIGPDKPPLITDVPRLSLGDQPSILQERSGALSTPAIGVFDPTAHQGLWLRTQQANEAGDLGLTIRESRDRRKAILSITCPVLREETLYRFMDNRQASWDTPLSAKPGDAFTLPFTLSRFACETVQGLFDRLADHRQASSAPVLRNTLPYSEAMRTLEDKFNRLNYAEPGYYSVGLRENVLQDWQIGWTGGMMSTLPLLAAGSPQTQARVLNMFDWLFPNGLSPSGFYWDSGAKGTQWYGGDIRKPHTKNWHLIRKSADAIYLIQRQFALMAKRGIALKPHWVEGQKRACSAFVKLWQTHGQLGQFVDSLTGDIRVGGSCSGAAAPAGLALAGSFFDVPEYKQAALEIGAYFYERFTATGLTYGGPGDALQCPDSESAYGLVQSYTALYEMSGDALWLSRALQAARQFGSWVVDYDFKFPAISAYAKLGIATTGGVYANAQNKHSAPGICTASGHELLKLYRYTKDTYVLRLLHEMAHNIPQYLSHPKNDIPGQPHGYVSERVNLTDWEGPDTIGYVLPLSTWAETALMMTTTDLPGLYLNPAENLCVAFDNIEASAQFRPSHIELTLYNPTACNAGVSLMIDRDPGRPLGEGYVQDLRKLNLKAGERRTLRV
ncbi:hypothetical protein PQU94_05365 [Asticcacaulis sp. DXS10W]|uniref:Uncharacterized protein n=1 Tax=Asticcacaulis currens TaxID=2984210 RepID=A0ABT5IBZ1_9CAUL|nr:hypothetical protein [Asticcacaulis currens]MDC7693708.1 hypothetical protein [Asticcacaulis currens]